MSATPERVVSAIKQAAAQGRRNIIFNCPSETLYILSVNKMHSIMSQLKDAPVKIFHVTGAFDGPETYRLRMSDDNLPATPTILVTNSQISLFVPAEPALRTLIDVPYTVGARLKKFVCFNRTHKGHRAYVLARCLENGLIAESYFSFEGGNPQWIDQLHIYDWAPVIHEQITKHRGIFPLRVNITENRNNPVQLQADDLQYHLNSYFSLVNETIFYKNGPERAQLGAAFPGTFFTEKTSRPLLLKHPFVLAAAERSLVALRSLGFKTFHPFIDETYDMEENDDVRLDMIVSETERLCRFTDEEWLQWQHNIMPIVEHNYSVIMQMHPHSYTNLVDKFRG